MSVKSTMVWATKYQLKTPKSIQQGTFDPNGQKEEQGSRLLPRDWVEDRNSQENNELYVVDEEYTAQLMKQREQNIIDNAEKAKFDNVGTADLVKAIAGLTGAAKSEPEVKKPEPKKVAEPVSIDPYEAELKAMEKAELQQICINTKVEGYHHAMGEEKLIELILKSK